MKNLVQLCKWYLIKEQPLTLSPTSKNEGKATSEWG